MRKTLLALGLVFLAASARAADNQAFLGIFAETKSTKMIGMPEMPQLPPGMDMSKMPGMAKMMAMFTPQRILTVRLWSPGIAPESATASIAPPPGLKQGTKLELELYRPKAEKTEGGGTVNPGGMPQFTIKRYWGSSPTVRPGQPEVITWGKLTPEQKALMERTSAKAGSDSYFYKPDWTTGYWPTKKQPGDIAKDAALVGNYALTTNYTGNVSIDAPDIVDFLGAIEMIRPSLKSALPLDSPIAFKWKPIPNLLGSHARIIGMMGKDTLIIWSSSEVKEDMGTDFDYMQMADVRRLVTETVMMKGDRTDVIVPVGIFKDCDIVSFMMTGYGPGAALDKAQPLPRIQTKTTLTIMLGGTKMPAGRDGMQMPPMETPNMEE